MRKFLIALIVLFFTPFVFADNLTSEMIQQIHDQVKISFFEGCSKEAKSSAIDICRCLADKTQANLNDKALSKCKNDDSGKECVVNAVKEASVKATSKQNILECKKEADIVTKPTTSSYRQNKSSAKKQVTTAHAKTSIQYD